MAGSWHPIASTTDLPPRHVYHGQLWGRELAVWRADDGFVNVWENRCLHRGVRLSIGINDGAELKCQYHGWRYANRTAGCTYIPAHPADAPARTICNRTYPGVERYGLVWSSLDGDGEPPRLPALEESLGQALRPIPVAAAPGTALTTLLAAELSRPDGTPAPIDLSGELVAATGDAVFFIQPVDAHRAVIRGVLTSVPADRLAALRHYNTALKRIAALAAKAESGSPAPLEPAFAPLPAEWAELEGPPSTGRDAGLRVVVRRKWFEAAEVAAFELAPFEGRLPTFQPGAHIDVHLPNGLVRQYSLTNGPGEMESYVIGVKREPGSAGGSSCLHDNVREGDVLAISAPRNNFPLRRDAVRTILIAGGIGITPLISMARALARMELPFELHRFVRTPEHVAFAAAGLPAHDHVGLDAGGTEAALTEILRDYAADHRLYVCGPGPMLDATRRIAAECGWPEDAVHFEYFSNTHAVDTGSSFEVALARSALTLQVPAGVSLLEALHMAGVEVPSSCETGACGTCLVSVIEGEPDHQDVYLRESEKRAGKSMLTCVSRAKSARLVLDL